MDGESLRILVADGDGQRREAIRSYLSSFFRYEVTIATNFEEALALAKGSFSGYQVILIDDSLPMAQKPHSYISGMELIEQIRKPNGVGLDGRTEAEYVIFVDYEQRRVLTENGEGVHFLIKPFTLFTLTTLINNLVCISRLGDATRLKRIQRVLLETAAAVLQAQDEREMMRWVVYGVKDLGYDRVRFYLLKENGKVLIGKAQVGGSDAFVGAWWEVKDDYFMEKLIREPRPKIFRRILGQPSHSEAVLEKEGVEEWASAPILLHGNVIGQIAADNKNSGRPLREEDINPIALFAALAASAIEHSKRTMNAERQHRDLKSVLEISNTISQAFNIEETLRDCCRAAAQLIGADHSGLVLFEGRAFGRVRAEWPTIGTTGESIIPVAGVEAEERLYDLQEAIVEPDVNRADHLGPVKLILQKAGIRSALIVPIISKDRVIGSLSLDALGHPRGFTDDELNMCKIFAVQVTLAIERTQLLEEARKHKERKELILKANNIITNTDDLEEGLRDLAEMITVKLDCAFCRVLLLDNTHKYIEAKAAAFSPRLEGRFSWNARLKESAHISAWEGLSELIEGGTFCVIQRSNERQAIFLEKLRRYLRLNLPPTELLLIPLVLNQEPVGVLMAGEVREGEQYSFTAEKRDLLNAIAAQVAIVIYRLQQLQMTNLLVARLAILNKINHYISRAQNSFGLEKILHVVLTGVTAGFGLGFNRAALFLRRDVKAQRLSGDAIEEVVTATIYGHSAIGCYLKSEWEDAVCQSLGDFEAYLKGLEEDSIRETPLGGAVRQITPIEVKQGAEADDIFSQVIFSASPMIYNPETDAKLPPSLIDVLKPLTDIAMVPLKVEGQGGTAQVIGVLVADNPFTRARITSEVLEILQTFADTAAIAVNNFHRMTELSAAHKLLRSLYSASNGLILPPDLSRAADKLSSHIMNATGAEWLRVILVDPQEQTQSLFEAGIAPAVEFGQEFRRNGVSTHVIRNGIPFAIEDKTAVENDLNPALRQDKCKSYLCLPITFGRRIAGVLWLGYSSRRELAWYEINALQLFVNHAFIAYENARHIVSMGRMQKAAKSLAGATEAHEVLWQICSSSRDVLEADSAFIWSYDKNADSFDIDSSVAVGVEDKEALAIFWKTGPRPAGTTANVIQHGYLEVENVSDTSRYNFLGGPKGDLLRRIGVGSFQGISLKVGREILGVLYVNYKRPRRFSRDEKKTARLFASQAALALRQARLSQQLKRALGAIRLLTERTTQAVSLVDLLNSTAERAQEALHCDALTLYWYDEATGRFGHPPGMAGVLYRELASKSGRVAQDTSVYRVLDLNELYIAEDVLTDPVIRGDFAMREGVICAAGIPLQVRDWQSARLRKVGVMFVNFRKPHVFTQDFINQMQIIANHAAVAIRDILLFEQMKSLKGYIGNHTVLTWIKIVSDSWGHEINKLVFDAKWRLEIIKKLIADQSADKRIPETIDELTKTLDEISATKIASAPGDEAQINSIQINDFLGTYVKRKRDHERYRGRGLTFNPQGDLDKQARIKFSRYWLRKALDLILDNAVRAVDDSIKNREPTYCKAIALSTFVDEDQVCISLKDNGDGIPVSIRSKIFENRINPEEGSQGSGVGLMLVKTIFAAYDGKITHNESYTEGTEMLISIPRKDPTRHGIGEMLVSG